MADVTLSSIRGTPRRYKVRLTASNASLAIPEWAQGGKGTVFVTGVGGGGSGAVTLSASARGGGGGGAAAAVSHPMLIPAGTTTIAVVIGAGGAGASGTAATVGNNGGNTTVTVAGLTLTLQGGKGASPGINDVGAPGVAYLGDVSNIPTTPTVSSLGPLACGADRRRGGPEGGYTLQAGAEGGYGSNASGGYGAGAFGPFGGGGGGVASVPTLLNGGSATGFGCGGAGAKSNGTTATSGSGSPGFVDLEFVEGF